MCQKFTPDELNAMDHKAKDDVIYRMQDRLDKPGGAYAMVKELAG